jgi:hypothetical protein
MNWEVLATTDAIFTTGIESYLHEGVLSKFNCWNKESNWFISDLFVMFFFQQRKKKEDVCS